MTPIDPFILEQYAGGDGDDGANDSEQPCPDCGYDLRGTPRYRPCPECGWIDQHAPLEPDAPLPEGTPCRKCGTLVAGMAVGSLCPDCVQPLLKGHPTCSACGYDMKGLPFKSLCPECGKIPGDGSSPTATAPNLPELPSRVQTSVRWQFGLFLLWISASGWLVIALLRTFGVIGNEAWPVVLTAVGAAVAASCWMVTMSAVDGRAWKWMAPARWCMRLLILGLPLATLADTLAVEVGVGLLGLVGLAMLLWFLAMMARVADAMYTSRRFELGWILCVPLGALTWLLPIPGGTIQLSRSAGSMAMMFIMLIILIPTVVLCWYVFRPSLSLFQEAQWASRNAAVKARHDARRRKGGTCNSCGHSLKGLMPNTPCPECGETT